MRELIRRLAEKEDGQASKERVCRGTLLSRQQYLYELENEGYADAREREVKGWNGDTAYPVRPRIARS
jgi:hypothetical protein